MNLCRQRLNQQPEAQYRMTIAAPSTPTYLTAARRCGFVTVLMALCVGLATLGFGAASASAQIQVKTLDDGTRVIYNESTVQRARRQAGRLLPPPSASGLDTIIRRYALESDLSPRLVQAVVQVESGYNVRALSSKGAIGLMQLMPDTARELGVRDPWDPAQNVRGGARYLKQQLQRFGGDLQLALAAYNAGPGAVSRYGAIPPYAETRNYVRKVLALYLKNPPQLLRDQASGEARQRRVQRVARENKEAKARGDKVYVTRDANNRIIFTTIPPGSP